jgi:hypothetical protein
LSSIVGFSGEADDDAKKATKATDVPTLQAVIPARCAYAGSAEALLGTGLQARQQSMAATALAEQSGGPELLPRTG